MFSKQKKVSFQQIQETYNSVLTKEQSIFLQKTFLYAALGFIFMFGVVTLTSTFFLDWILNSRNTNLNFIQKYPYIIWFVLIGISFLSIFLQFSWFSNISKASWSKIAIIYLIKGIMHTLFLTIMISAIILQQTQTTITGDGKLLFGQLNLGFMTNATGIATYVSIFGGFIFGISSIVFLLITFTSWYFNYRNIAFKLGSFFYKVILAIFVIYVGILLAVFFGGRNTITNYLSEGVFWILGFGSFFLILCVISISVYSIKDTLNIIDLSDKNIFKKYLAFFVFLFLDNLLRLVYYVGYIVFLFLRKR